MSKYSGVKIQIPKNFRSADGFNDFAKGSHHQCRKCGKQVFIKVYRAGMRCGCGGRFV